jgi:hypothetical protein
MSDPFIHHLFLIQNQVLSTTCKVRFCIEISIAIKKCFAKCDGQLNWSNIRDEIRDSLNSENHSQLSTPEAFVSLFCLNIKITKIKTDFYTDVKFYLL